MIPDECKRRECHYYREERENNARWCGHARYDMEVNQYPGWLSPDDAKYGNYDHHE